MATKPSLSDPQTPSKLDQKTVSKTIEALLKWNHSKPKNKNPKLPPRDDYLYLVITLKKPPPSNLTKKPYTIPLANPLYCTTYSELCLVIDDRFKSKENAQNMANPENIGVSKVLRLSKLKKDFRSFDAKRKLCDSYDLFLAEDTVVDALPDAMGKHFHKRKVPVPVDLRDGNDWKEQVEKACGETLLFLGKGTCSVLRIARGSMEKDEIFGNVVSAVNGTVDVVRKKWANVRSLHLKFAESLALPIYDMMVKIDSGDSVKEVEKMGKEVLKKGRIYEVKYMDSKVDDLSDDEDIGSDDDAADVSEDEKSDNNEMHIDEMVSKKRKKGLHSKDREELDGTMLKKKKIVSGKLKSVEMRVKGRK